MSDEGKKYCNSLYRYSRWKTCEVMVGNLGFGGDNPIRIQSMTTCDTMDTEASIAQSIRMIEAGCELVRFTAPSIKEARNLAPILQGIRNEGLETPLVADIHFTPNAAQAAAEIVEKVRINPGNFADKKKFETHDYSDASYQDELDRIREKLTPLVTLCKEKNVAIRIGTNHGSLSDRIMSRFGDTPLGMVESALEFIRMCREMDFHNIVVSMKSSNTRVMIQAYRLLANKMLAENMNYPLHLGVTEAGEGEDGRIKSAVGIGSLLEDGLGDTIRVSLTEEPEAEIPVAKILAERYKNRVGSTIEEIDSPVNPFEYQKRLSNLVLNIGGKVPPRVFLDLTNKDKISELDLGMGMQKCDFVYLDDTTKISGFEKDVDILLDYEGWLKDREKENCYPVYTVSSYLNSEDKSTRANFIKCSLVDLNEDFLVAIKSDSKVVLILETSNTHGMAEQRTAFFKLILASCRAPVIINRNYEKLSTEEFQMYAATDCGALLIDGLGDGIFLQAENIEPSIIKQSSFGILQASRTRISKTEYISCPSCGRTLFDLQKTTALIRDRTDHLKGLKIGIMGCIVNGPGEMADADYGYVGTGIGKITLYKQQVVVKKNVPEAAAVDELIELIKENGDWVDAQ